MHSPKQLFRRQIRERSPVAIVGGIERLFAAMPGRDATRGYAEQFSWDQTTAGQVQLFSRVIAGAP